MVWIVWLQLCWAARFKLDCSIEPTKELMLQGKHSQQAQLRLCWAAWNRGRHTYSTSCCFPSLPTHSRAKLHSLGTWAPVASPPGNALDAGLPLLPDSLLCSPTPGVSSIWAGWLFSPTVPPFLAAALLLCALPLVWAALLVFPSLVGHCLPRLAMGLSMAWAGRQRSAFKMRSHFGELQEEHCSAEY